MQLISLSLGSLINNQNKQTNMQQLSQFTDKSLGVLFCIAALFLLSRLIGQLRWRRTGPIPIADAIDALSGELQIDPDYYNGWKANISCCIQDELAKHTESQDIPHVVKNSIANEAAERFMCLLVDRDPGA